jgi:RIO kinase 1
MAAPDDLSYLVEEGVIDAIHSRLMSGKEATVYVVERAGFMGAAKVYRARDDRTFKKTSSYTEGRNQTRNSRDRRAMDKKTSYGRGLMEEGWQDMEFRALRLAWDAGVRVPEPFFLHENVLFMELILNDEGAPASRLADFDYTPERAGEMHLEIFLQVKALLETGQIHGDLSAYNVLMGARGPTIIDLPQVVDASKNNNARHILGRDLRNVTEHLARFDARLLRFTNCGDALFRHLERGTLGMVNGPEESAPQSRGGGGRRGRDAERGRAGRDKGQRPRPPEQHGRPPAQTGRPPLQTGRPPLQTGRPPIQTGRPPVQTGRPPIQTGRPPIQTGRPPIQTGRVPEPRARPPEPRGPGRRR